MDYEKLLSSITAPEPPAGLAERILLRIGRRERRILGAKIAASVLAFGASLAVIVTGYTSLVSALAKSGFFGIARLMFTDFSAMAANFPDFALSMVETFPVFIAALLLGGILAAVWSVAALIDETALFRRTRMA